MTPSHMLSADRLRRFWKIADAVSIAGLVFFTLYYLTAYHFETLFTVPSRQVDFYIWRFIPNYIFEQGRYPASATGDWKHALFPYLPSAAAMLLPLSWPPLPVAFVFWMAVEVTSFAIVVWAGLRLSGAAALPGCWLIALVATLLCENSLGWDFRNHNTNIVYLALVMLGLLSRRLWLSTLLIALSINLKLYSALIPIIFAWRREFRLAAATILVTLFIAIGLPAVVFGPSKLPQLFADWLAQVDYTRSPVNQANEAITLIRPLSILLSADPASNTVSMVLRIVQIAWLALVGCYFFFTAKAQSARALSYDQARLADSCVALIVTLPLSTWLMPYHAVVLLPAYMLLVAVAASSGWPKFVRALAAGACVTNVIVHFAIGGWDLRGAEFLITFVVVVVALAAIRRWEVLKETEP